MANINLLDPQIANLIAAGEVVERPANVVKELLENAIDAQSTSVVTEIAGGGVELIRVTDNGCGMEKEDLSRSVRRHATSKIRCAEDLDAISTLGFRGEALAAISSTSRFTLMSKRKEDPVGHQLILEGEETVSSEECGCADGTTVLVRDLFFNQPARRKFLKRAQTESSAILQYIQRLAVSHPEIAFRHIQDGVTKLQTAGNGKLFDCIWSVYGQDFASSLVEVRHTEGPLRLHGYVTRPENARTGHTWQSFYINTRLVKSGTMRFALEEAYKSFVKSERFPGCVLFLTLDPDRVDVNVHPAKLEVRFDDERSVYNAVYNGVRGTLQNLSNRLARDEFRRAAEKAAEKGVPVAPIHETRETPRPSGIIRNGSYREKNEELSLFAPAPARGKSPLVPAEERLVPENAEAVRVDPEVLFPKEPTAAGPAAAPPAEKAETEEAESPVQISMPSVLPREKKDNPLTLLGNVRGTVFHAYILYETEDTLYLIDKHAAHERILYESLKKSHTEDSVQLFLQPLLLHLPAVESAAISEHLSELCEAGFLLEEFGEGSFLLRGIPAELDRLNEGQIKALIEESASELMLGGKAAGAGAKKFDRILYSMACKAAVKAGIPSTEADHQWIVEKLREIDNVTVCPHGRPVLVPFTKKQIEALFLRT